MPSALQQLKKAKAYSDVRDYPRKVAILRSLIQESPSDFSIDSRDKGIVGVTHKPTGFRIHMPSSAFPKKIPEQDKYVYHASPKPDLNKFIKYIEEEARKRGVKDMHVVMSHPDHPLGGGSAHYTTDLDKDSKSALLVKALRGKMREWEQQQGLDPDHDWSKIASTKE
jgi:hypothetical protein